MSGHPNNQDNLDDIYSDFSEQEEQPKRKNSSASNKPPGIAPSAIKMPAFLGGRAFIPPPPPTSSRPKQMNTIPNQIFLHRPQGSNFHGPPQQNQRQRKSTIFIKNIPKSCNRQQTLTTYFRTYGNIKSIKTCQQANSAVVRFQREQDAFRFMATKPLILNRSYIMYDINDDFAVPAASIAEKQKDQAGVVNSSEKQVIILKQNNQSLVADKYRCLLYLNKHRDRLTEQECDQIGRQMAKCRKIKESQSNNHELAQMLINFENNYDWTLSYKVITKEPIQKKKVISQYNKYGPIGTISVKLTSLTGNTTTDQSTDGIQDKLGIVRIKYLAVRSSWAMYLENSQNLNLDVEGSKLKNIYKSWFVKKQQQQLQEKAKILKKQDNEANEVQNQDQIEEQQQNNEADEVGEPKQEQNKQSPKDTKANSEPQAVEQKSEEIKNNDEVTINLGLKQKQAQKPEDQINKGEEEKETSQPK